MDDDATFSIKQVAELFGVTRGAVRFFQEKGLVEPAILANGYRSYSSDDVLRLLYYKRLTSLSFTLEETVSRLGLEANAPLCDIIDFMGDKESEIERAIARQKRQVDRVRKCRQCLMDVDSGLVRVIESPAYWDLAWEHIPLMAVEEPETLELFFSLIPETVVGGVFDLRSPDVSSTAAARVPEETAQREGLPFSRFFTILPASSLAMRTVRCVGENQEEQLARAVVALRDFILEQGREPSGSAFSQVILSHAEGEDRVEYHVLYLGLRSLPENE